jgi:hypothetical protein
MHKTFPLTSLRRLRRDLSLKISHLQIACGPWQVGNVGVAGVVVNTCLRDARSCRLVVSDELLGCLTLVINLVLFANRSRNFTVVCVNRLSRAPRLRLKVLILAECAMLGFNQLSGFTLCYACWLVFSGSGRLRGLRSSTTGLYSSKVMLLTLLTSRE